MQPEHEREFSIHIDPFSKIIWIQNVVSDTANHMKVSDEARIHLLDVHEALSRLFKQLCEMKVLGYENVVIFAGEKKEAKTT